MFHLQYVIVFNIVATIFPQLSHGFSTLFHRSWWPKPAPNRPQELSLAAPLINRLLQFRKNGKFKKENDANMWFNGSWMVFNDDLSWCVMIINGCFLGALMKV